MDGIVGALLDKLEELRLDGNTLVILTSDNGPEVTTVVNMRKDHQHDGARPWRGVKRDQWEGGHRVPLLVKWPARVKPSSIADQTVSLTDLMATCAAITGFALPDEAAEDSFDLLPVLSGADGGGVGPSLHPAADLGGEVFHPGRPLEIH
jgi:arylsulfatase A